MFNTHNINHSIGSSTTAFVGMEGKQSTGKYGAKNWILHSGFLPRIVKLGEPRDFVAFTSQHLIFKGLRTTQTAHSVSNTEFLSMTAVMWCNKSRFIYSPSAPGSIKKCQNYIELDSPVSETSNTWAHLIKCIIYYFPFLVAMWDAHFFFFSCLWSVLPLNSFPNVWILWYRYRQGVK